MLNMNTSERETTSVRIIAGENDLEAEDGAPLSELGDGDGARGISGGRRRRRGWNWFPDRHYYNPELLSCPPTPGSAADEEKRTPSIKEEGRVPIIHPRGRILSVACLIIHFLH